MEKAPVCEQLIIHKEAAEKAAAALKPENPADIAAWFKLLGDPTRLRIMLALESTELCVCDLCAVLGMNKSAISHQLNTLRANRLVKYRRSGKNVYYSLDDDHVVQVVSMAREHLAEAKI